MESVLIVDDEKDNLEALKRLLRQDFAVTAVDSGIEALKKIQTQEFAVIVSDQRMPGMTGVDLLEKAKLLQPASVRILLTGYTEVESIIGAINRGHIFRYIAKPWDPEDLKITLRQAAESFRLKKEVEEKTRALQAAFDQLRTLDRAKSRFLSLVSHELNTPLTGVSAFVALLKEQKAGFPADLQRAVSSLSSASDRLGEIVQEVLEYVGLEAEGQWPAESFDWVKETQAAVTGLDALRSKKQVDFALKGEADVKSQCASKTRLALRKLLNEALRRSAAGSRVQVSFAKQAGNVSVKIAWTGDAISAADLQAFETSGQELNHHRNLALGLAIAKRILDRQGGTLTVEDGPALRLTLPA
ncbi:hybrid sensor histidine kinase/response regulator [bacterium]|nr:hybrid sensor histidine kinase/response regulator [bacterium]